MSFLSAESRAALQLLLALDEDAASRPLDRLAALRALVASLDADPAALRAAGRSSSPAHRSR